MNDSKWAYLYVFPKFRLWIDKSCWVDEGHVYSLLSSHKPIH